MEKYVVCDIGSGYFCVDEVIDNDTGYIEVVSCEG